MSPVARLAFAAGLALASASAASRVHAMPRANLPSAYASGSILRAPADEVQLAPESIYYRRYYYRPYRRYYYPRPYYRRYYYRPRYYYPYYNRAYYYGRPYYWR